MSFILDDKKLRECAKLCNKGNEALSLFARMQEYGKVRQRNPFWKEFVKNYKEFGTPVRSINDYKRSHQAMLLMSTMLKQRADNKVK